MSYGGNMQSYGDMTQGQPNPKTEYDYIVEELAPQTAPEILGPLKGIEGLLRTADRTPDKIGSNLGMSLLAYAFPWLRDRGKRIGPEAYDGKGGQDYYAKLGEHMGWEGKMLSTYPPSPVFHSGTPSQYPSKEYEFPDGTGFSWDPSNPDNLDPPPFWDPLMFYNSSDEYYMGEDMGEVLPYE